MIDDYTATRIQHHINKISDLVKNRDVTTMEYAEIKRSLADLELKIERMKGKIQ